MAMLNNQRVTRFIIIISNDSNDLMIYHSNYQFAKLDRSATPSISFRSEVKVRDDPSMESWGFRPTYE